MDNVLKPKTGRVSKSPIDKSVSGDKDFGNTDARELQNSMHATDKYKSKQMDVGEIKGKSPPFTAKHLEKEKNDGSHEHHLNGTGIKVHDSNVQVKISSKKERKTRPERITMAEHGGPSADAVVPVGSGGGRETTELESVYEEDESVFDDKLVFEDGFLGYETSSMSLNVFTDRVMSEELTADDDLEEDSSYCYDDSSPEENEKPSPALEIVRASDGTQSLHPDELEATDTGYAAVDKNFPKSQISKQSSACSSQRSPQSGIIIRRDVKDDIDHICDSSDELNLHPKQPHHLAVGVESLERHQLSGKSASLSSQKPSWTEPGKSNSCDDIDWHLESLFETSSDVATPVNDNTAPKSHGPSASISDQHMASNLFQASAYRPTTDARGEQNSGGRLRSLKNNGFCDICHPRFGDSAADDVEGTRSNAMPNSLRHLSSSDSCSSDWHLSSMFYDESASVDEGTRRRSIGRYSSATQSSKSSVDSSEWHISSLLFKSSDLSSSQLSGDSCVQCTGIVGLLMLAFFFRCLSCIYCVTFFAANASLYDLIYLFSAPDVQMNKIC